MGRDRRQRSLHTGAWCCGEGSSIRLVNELLTDMITKNYTTGDLYKLELRKIKIKGLSSV